MKKYLKITLGILIVILVGIGLLAVAFVLEMKPDKAEEEKIKTQAEQYLEKNFNDDFEIFDTLYDNMGNFEFEYAAKARDKNTNIQFLVYQDVETSLMVDTYITAKWENDLESEIRPFIKGTFGDSTDLFVFFDDKIGQEFNIDPAHPGSYKKYDVSPAIRISVPRKKSGSDEKNIDELITFLKNEVKLQNGSVIMEYIAEKGAILDDEWGKEF